MSSRALSLWPMPLSRRMSVPRPKILRKPAEMVVWSADSGGPGADLSATGLLLLRPEDPEDVGRRRRLEQLRRERPRRPGQGGDGGPQTEPGAGSVLGRDEEEEHVRELAVHRL